MKDPPCHIHGDAGRDPSGLCSMCVAITRKREGGAQTMRAIGAARYRRDLRGEAKRKKDSAAKGDEEQAADTPESGTPGSGAPDGNTSDDDMEG